MMITLNSANRQQRISRFPFGGHFLHHMFWSAPIFWGDQYFSGTGYVASMFYIGSGNSVQCYYLSGQVLD